MIVHGPNRQSQTTAVQPDIHFFFSFLLLNRGAKALSMPATTKKGQEKKKKKASIKSCRGSVSREGGGEGVPKNKKKKGIKKSARCDPT